ncbi:hypothetical protein KL925_001981 [Ogataea polymorpha]|nr:hypothetical protein KL937_001510 [Ogataea polymorpha]KAG7918287.1 hypothetical protein KL927_001744 [Ogataea polymorpha]KAG7927623.1 hypothetical protein KL925_001981 [Ogataea polymorpha]KAG7938977.1 hypothetical protein KL904_001506 [Ogataea polymorpha]
MEVSLSVEETNQLRAKLGLPLISTNDRPSGDKREDNDLDETNKIRSHLGLPLITSEKADNDPEYENYRRAEDERRKQKQLDELQQRIAKTKSDLHRRKLESGETLLARLDKEENTDDEWLAKLGTSQQVKVARKRKAKLEDDDLQGVSVAHSKEDYAELLGESQEVVFTLKDKSVFEEEEDQLESHELANRRRVKEFLGNQVNGDKDSDNKEQDNVFRLGEKIIPKKQTKKLVSLDLDDDEQESQSSDYNAPVIKRLKSKVRNKRSDKEELKEANFQRLKLINEDLEKEDDIELNKFLSASRQQRQQSRPIAIEERQQEEGAVVLDEDADFLEKLNGDDTVEKTEKVEDVADTTEPSSSLTHVSEKLAVLHDEVDANMGLSRTLKLLKDRAELTSRSDGSKINLVYRDDKGRVLNQKEAYKYLSHRFHGHKK